jgi:signal transduction histidine kinase
VFPENEPMPWKKAAILFAPGAVLLPAVAAGLLWRGVSLTDSKFAIDLTPLGYIFVLYVYGIFAYGFWLLWSKYRYYRAVEAEAVKTNAPEQQIPASFYPDSTASYSARIISRIRTGPRHVSGNLQAQQLGALLWALVITGVLKTFANIILPYFGDFRLLRISAVFVLPGVFIYAYAISNFKLFSLQSALDQFRLFPIAYKIALSIALVAIISFALLQIPIVWWAFSAGPTPEAWRRYLIFSVITALLPNLLLVALVIRTISRPLRRVTEAAVAVAGGAYGTEVELRSNDEVGLLAASFNEMSRKMAADIEQLRQLNEHLIRTEKLAAAGTLAAGVAHEVNNPLASISSLLQILQTRPQTDAEAREMLNLMQGQITRITQVLRDLMDFARVRPPERSRLNINETVEAALRLARFDKGFQKIEVTTAYTPCLPQISADAGQLQQVFLNLFLNARDAMPDGGRLRVTTSHDAHSLAIAISDTGPGIAPEHRAHIFDPFYTTKSAGTGTGLGLAVCYGIINAHGGQIEIAGNNGRGATFRVILPSNE